MLRYFCAEKFDHCSNRGISTAIGIFADMRSYIYLSEIYTDEPSNSQCRRVIPSPRLQLSYPLVL